MDRVEVSSEVGSWLVCGVGVDEAVRLRSNEEGTTRRALGCTCLYPHLCATLPCAITCELPVSPRCETRAEHTNSRGSPRRCPALVPCLFPQQNGLLADEGCASASSSRPGMGRCLPSPSSKPRQSLLHISQFRYLPCRPRLELLLQSYRGYLWSEVK